METDPAKVAAGLSESAKKAVTGAQKMVSGGTRVSFMTLSETWCELEDAGLLKARISPCMISSYLAPLGLAVREILMKEGR